MSSNFRIQISKLFGIFVLVFFANSCGLSIPNLEQIECTQARTRIKEFYSTHFGNDMKPSNENLQLRERFLSKDLFGRLLRQTNASQDYFTKTEDYPKAFGVGKCEAVSPEKTVFEVLLFWKDDNRSEQREIKVEVIKVNNDWLINKVENE